MTVEKLQDRRQSILDAALAVLREYGYAGFTQPRVAARTGMRQSHLTYYLLLPDPGGSAGGGRGRGC